MDQFQRMRRLPPYVFHILDELKQEALASGQEIIDFGMENSGLATPQHIIDALREASTEVQAHGYSDAGGMPALREALCAWYARRYGVQLDAQTQTIATMGSREGLAHLMLAVLGQDDVVLVPSPTSSIHTQGCVIADANVRPIPLCHDKTFFKALEDAIKSYWPRPKMMMLNFPGNPTGHCVSLRFMEKIVALAREHQIYVVNDFSSCDLTFDGYKAPSILQVPGAEEVAVESYSLSKGYNMFGWRMGFLSGNADLVRALSRVRRHMSYGHFTPVQMAAIAALTGSDDCVKVTRAIIKKRRDALCDALNQIGWPVEAPKAGMSIWARIPEAFANMGSLEFSKFLLKTAGVFVYPGVGFGEFGNHHVRFALSHDEATIYSAASKISMLLSSATMVS